MPGLLESLLSSGNGAAAGSLQLPAASSYPHGEDAFRRITVSPPSPGSRPQVIPADRHPAGSKIEVRAAHGLDHRQSG